MNPLRLVRALVADVLENLAAWCAQVDTRYADRWNTEEDQ